MSKTNDQGDNSSGAKDLVDWILEVFHDKLTDGLNLGWWEFIFTVELNSILLILGSVINSSLGIGEQGAQNGIWSLELLHDLPGADDYSRTTIFLVVVVKMDDRGQFFGSPLVFSVLSSSNKIFSQVVAREFHFGISTFTHLFYIYI